MEKTEFDKIRFHKFMGIKQHNGRTSTLIAVNLKQDKIKIKDMDGTERWINRDDIDIFIQ